MKMEDFMAQPSLFWLLLFVLTAAAVTGGALAPAEQLATMTWMEGKWTGLFGGNRFEATYSSPEGGAILSMNKEFLEGHPCYVEFERFGYDDTGAFLIPYPGGRPKDIKFRLIGYDPAVKRASFQNRENDWPTDIIYERVSEDSLFITLSGPAKDSDSMKTMQLRLGKK